MSPDLTAILQDWPYEPGQINARLIRGDDGEPKIQLRLDLGILQMEAEARPDGQRPHGFDSLLEYYEARIDDGTLMDDAEGEEEGEGTPAAADGEPEEGDLGLEDALGEAGDEDSPFPEGVDDEDEDEEGTPRLLGPTACRELREEAVQYYHRYIAMLVLEDYEAVVRDTTRNLRLLDLCRDHAMKPEDAVFLEQFRPYLTMMRARALASAALQDNEPRAALLAIDEGIEALRKIYADVGRPEEAEESTEFTILHGMRAALAPQLPVSQKAELRERLRQAVLRENYELAAILRDELRQLGERP